MQRRLGRSYHEIKSIDSMTVIAHISDLHISKSSFDEEILIEAINEINSLNPDMVILTGDITNKGYYKEFKQATR